MNENNIEYTQCYVAFIDILGFAELVKKSEEQPKILETLVRMLNEAAALPPDDHSQNKENSEKGSAITRETHHFQTQIHAFSDSITLFLPVETHALSWLLRKVQYIHDRILELEACVRGGVTIGNMYWDHSWSSPQKAGPVEEEHNDKSDRETILNAKIVLGPAQTEAYRLESETAIYPRIIFSTQLMKHLHELKPTDKASKAFPLSSPGLEHSDLLITDFVLTNADDGVPFLDVFHRTIDRVIPRESTTMQRDDGQWETRLSFDKKSYEDFMTDSRKVIEKFLQGKPPSKVRAKHLWLANYFNGSLVRHNIRNSIQPFRIKW